MDGECYTEVEESMNSRGDEVKVGVKTMITFVCGWEG